MINSACCVERVSNKHAGIDNGSQNRILADTLENAPAKHGEINDVFQRDIHFSFSAKKIIPDIQSRFVGKCYAISRPLIDLTVSSLILLWSLPAILVAGVIIKLTSKGNVFYIQERVGLNGHVFKIIKLRSMLVDSEDNSGAVWARNKDDRVTKIGRFLRKTHMDELPQLLNMLKGDMSLIGPRPERPVFVDKFVEKIPGYRKRLSVKPGITGLAQCYYKYDENTRDVCRKLRYDILYINKKGWLLDLRVTFLTICKMFFKVNGHG